MQRKNLFEMTFLEAAVAFQETDTALLSVGSVEQHGPACALGLDTACSWEITQRVARLVDCVYAPPLPIGFARQWMGFAGTLMLRRSTFEAMVEDVCKSLMWHGSKRIVIINGHGRNTAILNDIALRLKYETNALIVHIDWWKIGNALKAEIGLENSPEELPIGHGSELETSALWAVSPDYVRPDKFLKEEVGIPLFGGSRQLTTAPVETPISMKYPPFGGYQPGIGLDGGQHTRSGIVGSSLRASREKGERAFKHISERIAEFVRELQKIPLKDVIRPPQSFY